MTQACSLSPDKILARDLGLGWRETGMVPVGDVSFQLALAAGIAPLDEARSGFRIAISPSEAVLRASAHHDLKDRTDVVVMPVAAFRAMIREHAGHDIADKASHDLARQWPGQSAVNGMSVSQRVAGLAMIGIFVLGLLIYPQAALIVLAILTIPLFAALLVLRLGAVIDGWTPTTLPTLPMPDAKLPIYTVLVPLYREAAVLDQLLAALLALDYPPSRLDIKILVEKHDDVTREALARHVLPAHVDVVVAPSGAPRTKPRALNVGLLEARGTLLTIYDAEDRPDPRQLRLAANLFARHSPDVACLQGRLVIDNT
ncbi:MAG: glycosyltransferase, partial [Bosea sp. (in: a-proteobacteria)]